jgi:hypothetical protein
VEVRRPLTAAQRRRLRDAAAQVGTRTVFVDVLAAEGTAVRWSSATAIDHDRDVGRLLDEANRHAGQMRERFIRTVVLDTPQDAADAERRLLALYPEPSPSQPRIRGFILPSGRVVDISFDREHSPVAHQIGTTLPTLLNEGFQRLVVIESERLGRRTIFVEALTPITPRQQRSLLDIVEASPGAFEFEVDTRVYSNRRGATDLIDVRRRIREFNADVDPGGQSRFRVEHPERTALREAQERALEARLRARLERPDDDLIEYGVIGFILRDGTLLETGYDGSGAIEHATAARKAGTTREAILDAGIARVQIDDIGGGGVEIRRPLTAAQQATVRRLLRDKGEVGIDVSDHTGMRVYAGGGEELTDKQVERVIREANRAAEGES